MSDSTSDEAVPLLRVTDAARAMVREVRASEADADRLALWLEVSGASAGAYSYDMWFQLASDAGGDDVVQHHDDLVVVIQAGSVERLRGATLDTGGAGSADGRIGGRACRGGLDPANLRGATAHHRRYHRDPR